MENPTKLKVAVLALAGLSLLLATALAWSLWQSFLWRRTVDGTAQHAGWQWAMRSFAKGSRIIYDLSKVAADENVAPYDLGRREGPFEVWSPARFSGMSFQDNYADRKVLEAYNKQMREIYSNPEHYREEFGSSMKTNAQN